MMTFDERFAMIVDAEWDAPHQQEDGGCCARPVSPIPRRTLPMSADADRKLDRTKLIGAVQLHMDKRPPQRRDHGASETGRSWIACALKVAACNAFFSVRYVGCPKCSTS